MMVVRIEAREFHLSGVIDDLTEARRRLEDARLRLERENGTLRAEVSELRIHVDRDKKDREVETIAESDYFKAKMMLAAQGLPKSAPDGNSMIDSLPMGASRAVEGEKLRSAREMDLARTIEAIDSVESAKIHLAVEPPSVFLRERSKPSASVMLLQ